MTDNSSKLKELARQLHAELQQTEAPDPEALALMEDLGSDLQGVLERNQSSNEVVDLLTTLESRFAADHPVAERTIRDIIDTLGKMGI